jgi:hypothetical protein
MIEMVSAEKEYKKMVGDREQFLNRAKSASKLTLPQLYPDNVETANTTYSTPYQSLGARGVNNLANKMILSLFPPATAFFKLGVNALALQDSGVSEGDMQQAMYKVEKGIVNEMEISQLRSVLVDGLKQGAVGGSVVLHIPETGKPKAYTLSSFGCKRSKAGSILRMVIREQLNYLELPKDVRESIEDNINENERDGKKPLDVYTLIMLGDDDKYETVQEVKGMKISGTQAKYKKEDLPFVFVPFVDRGEDYGRSYVEDFIGDLQSYEGLRQAILEAAAESARLIYLVRPNAIITPKKLQKARSGDVLQGNPDDVSTLQADKRLDVGMAQQEAEVLRGDLATVFLLDSAVRRNAERVTAEEIRRVSQELEVALGGIYSTLANVLQEPLVRLYLKRLVKKGFIKDILKNNIELEITTGSAALGRGTEFRAIQSFMEAAVGLLGEQAGQFLNVPEALARMAYSLDVNTADLIKSPEQLAQEKQQAQQEQLQQQAVAPAINAANQQDLANKQQG